MPFGLCGAPATFQRLMDRVIRDKGGFARTYLDDLVIFSSSWEDHLDHLSQIFQRLEDAGLTTKLRKCQFGMSECSYLGHVVGGGLTRPEEQKTEAIRSYPQPSTKKQVRAFLGLAGYYQRFILHFAHRARPLTELTRKKMPDRVVWAEECEAGALE